MVKRKVSTNGDAAATTTKKPKSKTPENGKLDISTPEVCLLYTSPSPRDRG